MGLGTKLVEQRLRNRISEFTGRKQRNLHHERQRGLSTKVDQQRGLGRSPGVGNRLMDAAVLGDLVKS